MRRGEYAAAAGLFSTALQLLPVVEENALQPAEPAGQPGALAAADMLLQRAACQRETGDLAAVIADCSAALGGVIAGEMTAQALLMRALAYGATEKYALGVKDCAAMLDLDAGDGRARNTLRCMKAALVTCSSLQLCAERFAGEHKV